LIFYSFGPSLKKLGQYRTLQSVSVGWDKMFKLQYLRVLGFQAITVFFVWAGRTGLDGLILGGGGHFSSRHRAHPSSFLPLAVKRFGREAE
jgi:hypothetical protein